LSHGHAIEHLLETVSLARAQTVPFDKPRASRARYGEATLAHFLSIAGGAKSPSHP